MLINLTNHPSTQWSREQTEAAAQYGAIEDLPFPQILPSMSDGELNVLVHEYELRVLSTGAKTVLLQGEGIFVYRLTLRLKRRHIRVIAAVGERRAAEVLQPDGSTIKQSEYRFCGFREY